MKKLLGLIIVFALFATRSLAAPVAPVLTYTTNGVNITVDWSVVPEATGYTLLAAPYPFTGMDSILSFDMGMNNSYSIDLWDGAAYYVAVQSHDAVESSGYSNIEYFITKQHQMAWQDKAAMGGARTQSGGAVIDNKIYAFGGYDENNLLLNTLEIYTPETDSWEPGASNTKSVADLAGVAQENELYIFGATGDECGTTNFAEKYNPEADLWTALQPKTVSASGAPAVSYNNQIYLFGGWEENSCEATGKVLKDTVEVYNPSANSWQSKAAMPKALEGAAVAVYDDKAYLMGGVDADGNYATDIIAYDFANDSWIESGLGTLTTPRLFPSSTTAPVIEDTIILIGGWVDDPSWVRSSGSNGRVETNIVEFYNPRTKSVAIGEPLPEATAGHLPAVIGGELYLIGGMANEHATNRTQRTDVTINNEDNTTYLAVDSDGDGYTTLQGDCNDANASMNPGVTDICGDGIDQDCSGTDAACSAATGTVTSPTGRVWMDRNLGATRVATSYDDAAAYGDLYQWGRGTDGHEKRNSPTITSLSSSDTPGHGSFILTLNDPEDWRSPQNGSLWQGGAGVNNPYPSGFRLPTSAEWEAERATWAQNNRDGAFASPLKLVSAGYRNGYGGSTIYAGSYGYYWSSSVNGSYARFLYLGGVSADAYNNTRASGFSVRCLED